LEDIEDDEDDASAATGNGECEGVETRSGGVDRWEAGSGDGDGDGDGYEVAFHSTAVSGRQVAGMKRPGSGSGSGYGNSNSYEDDGDEDVLAHIASDAQAAARRVHMYGQGMEEGVGGMEGGELGGNRGDTPSPWGGGVKGGVEGSIADAVASMVTQGGTGKTSDPKGPGLGNAGRLEPGYDRDDEDELDPASDEEEQDVDMQGQEEQDVDMRG